MKKNYKSLLVSFVGISVLSFFHPLISMEKADLTTISQTCSIRKKVDSGMCKCDALRLIHNALTQHHEQEARNILQNRNPLSQNKDFAAELYFVAIADFPFAHEQTKVCAFLSNHILSLNKTWHTNSKTLLGETVRAQNMYLVQLLINAGADLDISLHCAVAQNDVNLCKKLIDLGANPYTKDEYGSTAFEYVWKKCATTHRVMQILKREDTWKGWIKAKVRGVVAYCN